jgi:hypothetical protein
MSDFVGAVYRGQGQYNMAGSIATGEGGVIMRRGSVLLTPRGQYQKVGSVYLTQEGVCGDPCGEHLHRRGRGDCEDRQYLYRERSNDHDCRQRSAQTRMGDEVGMDVQDPSLVALVVLKAGMFLYFL